MTLLYCWRLSFGALVLPTLIIAILYSARAAQDAWLLFAIQSGAWLHAVSQYVIQYGWNNVAWSYADVSSSYP
jgi:hypothetical protein